MTTSTESVTSDLRYPIGRYQPPKPITSAERGDWLIALEDLPLKLRRATGGLSEAQLDTPYRPGGWTVRQLVHHIADSHLNSYTRFRFALTEQVPAIKAYEEAVWAELADARTAPIEPSLQVLDGLHTRWVILLRSLTDDEFARTFRHPALGEISLEWTLGLYAWHSRHHVAHILNLRSREGW